LIADSKKNSSLPGNKFTELKKQQADIITLEKQIVLAIQDNACKLLQVGCFARGMGLKTTEGYKAVETFKPGDRLLARNEFDPFGPIVEKIVEEVFERTGRILLGHLSDGRILRTTQEHPFFEKSSGWTPIGELHAGDVIRTENGWTTIEELFDTGEYETVYNVRVADCHTYFVGQEEWSEAVWAHNAYVAPIPRPGLNWGPSTIGGKVVYGTAQDTSNGQDPNNPHAVRINAIVAALAPNAPAGTYFVLNRSWRTALGRPNVDVDPRFDPDIIIVQPLDPPGTPHRRFKIHAFEVDHLEKQTFARQQLANGWSTVNKQMARSFKARWILCLCRARHRSFRGKTYARRPTQYP